MIKDYVTPNDVSGATDSERIQNAVNLAKEKGYNTVIAFVIQMDNVKYFTPNNVTHKAFGDALIKAYNSGVEILCLDCNVTENSLEIKDKVDYKL